MKQDIESGCNFRRLTVFWIVVGLLGIALLVAAVAAGPLQGQTASVAATPPPAAFAPSPLSDADARQVRELQLRLTAARLEMSQAVQNSRPFWPDKLRERYDRSQAEEAAAIAALEDLLPKLQQRSGCTGCDLDVNLHWKQPDRLRDITIASDPAGGAKPVGSQKESQSLPKSNTTTTETKK